MEDLLSHLSILSSQTTFQDNNLDPTVTDELMKLFELDAYKSWAAMELHNDDQGEGKKSEESMIQLAEDDHQYHLNLDSALEELEQLEGARGMEKFMDPIDNSANSKSEIRGDNLSQNKPSSSSDTVSP